MIDTIIQSNVRVGDNVLDNAQDAGGRRMLELDPDRQPDHASHVG
jgi:hypothetical protein